MNANEKRILTVLNQAGPSTRKEIGAACGISWAATVKLVSRLEAKGFLRCLGESEAKTENGKTSLVYGLAPTRPLALGIDVEYSTTRAAVFNLRQEVLHTECLPNAEFADEGAFVSFLGGIVERCSAALAPRGLALDGVGVGMPSWLVPSRKPLFAHIARALSESSGLPAVVDNNTRAYTLHLQRALRTGGSFASFIVRTGLGVGIAMNGELYRGEDGLAGELGHLTIDPEGPVCRCGKRGCAERYFNQHALAGRWTAAGGGAFPDDGAALEDLFGSYGAGVPAAKAVLAEACGYLLPPVSALSLSMDIRRIYLVGRFGPDGGFLADLLERALSAELHPRFRHRVAYLPLEDDGFLRGAAMLFLSGFCDYRVLGS